MQVLFINMAWDAAGCSYKQAQAINKHTDWTARHFRAVPTFYDDLDIGPENFIKDEFIDIIEKSDVIHFCSATDDYASPHNFEFDLKDAIKNKIKVFHDYNSFPGRWDERAKDQDYWNKKEEIGYELLFSSIPQALEVYKDCIYIPDVVDELSEEYSPSNINRKEVIIGHFPTGGGNNKNTNELLYALNKIKTDYNTDITLHMTSDVPHKEIIKIKKKCTLGFDALWRGFHGMTTVENLALGIPTLTNIDGNFEKIFKEFHQTDIFPFDIVHTTLGISSYIKNYNNNPEKLEERSKVVRDFMMNKWSFKNIADRIVQEYEKVL